jgi:hypothetical protein
LIAFWAPDGYFTTKLVTQYRRNSKAKGATHAKFHRNGKELATGDLCDFRAAFDTREVNEGRFDDAGLAIQRSYELFRKAEAGVCHGESGGTGAIFGLDDFIAAELNA